MSLHLAEINGRTHGKRPSAVTGTAEFREKLGTQATRPEWLEPAAFAARIREEVPAWAEVARIASIKAD